MTRPWATPGETYSPLNPEISPAARNAVRRETARLIRAGEITPKTACEVCGKDRTVEIHHRDYRDPRDVVWLCRPHHNAEHNRIKDDAKFGVQRARWNDRKARSAQKAKKWSEALKTAASVARAGGTLSDVVAATGLSFSSADFALRLQRIEPHRSARLPFDVEGVREMAASGASQAAIGARFGRTASNACTFMRRHGIAPAGRPKKKAGAVIDAGPRPTPSTDYPTNHFEAEPPSALHLEKSSVVREH